MVVDEFNEREHIVRITNCTISYVLFDGYAIAVGVRNIAVVETNINAFKKFETREVIT